jgi:hypothetical protein
MIYFLLFLPKELIQIIFNFYNFGDNSLLLYLNNNKLFYNWSITDNLNLLLIQKYINFIKMNRSIPNFMSYIETINKSFFYDINNYDDSLLNDEYNNELYYKKFSYIDYIQVFPYSNKIYDFNKYDFPNFLFNNNNNNSVSLSFLKYNKNYWIYVKTFKISFDYNIFIKNQHKFILSLNNKFINAFNIKLIKFIFLNPIIKLFYTGNIQKAFIQKKITNNIFKITEYIFIFLKIFYYKNNTILFSHNYSNIICSNYFFENINSHQKYPNGFIIFNNIDDEKIFNIYNVFDFIDPINDLYKILEQV